MLNPNHICKELQLHRGWGAHLAGQTPHLMQLHAWPRYLPHDYTPEQHAEHNFQSLAIKLSMSKSNTITP